MSSKWAMKIREEIYSLRQKMTDEQFFASKQLSDYLNMMLQTALDYEIRTKRKITLNTIFEPKTNFTAETDGTKVTVNMYGPLIRQLPDRQEKYYSLVGHVIHECGHVLFTDFREAEKNRAVYNSGTFRWLEMPDDVTAANECADYLNAHPNFRRYFAELFANIQNIYEDAYIENRLCSIFSGVFAYGIGVTRNETYRLLPDAEVLFQMIEDGKSDPARVLTALMHEESMGFPIKYNKSMTSKYSLIAEEFMNDIQAYAYDLQSQQVSSKRTKAVNEIMLRLYKVMNKPDESQSSQQNSDLTLPELQNQIKALKDQLESQGMTKIPKGDSTPISRDKNISPDAAANAMENAQQSQSMNPIFREAEESVMKNKAGADVHDEYINELQEHAAEIQQKHNYQGTYRPWKYDVLDIEPESTVYDRQFALVEDVAADTVRILKRHLEELEKKNRISRGHMIGKFDSRAVASHAFINDGKVFERKDQRNHKPDIVFALRIDCSGSMAGKKQLAASNLGILFDEILRNINVPYMIIGDNSSSAECRIALMHEFEETDGNDRYRLANIPAGGSNRDAAALMYVCEKLLERPERKKVCISISDGEPTQCSYKFGTTEYREDTKRCVNEYAKKGIEIFGAVIDGEFDNIRQIYGERTMDLTDLNKLSEELVGLIRRYVLRS